MAQLLNTASATGVYQSIEVNESSTQVVVQLNAIGLEKSADRLVWVDQEDLVYTILARNLDESDPGLPVEQVVISDRIDRTVAGYVDGSATVVIGETPVVDPPVTYDDPTGDLAISVGTIPAGETATVTFRVAKN